MAAEPDDAPVCIAPSKACEAVRGLFRSRRPPVWHTVLGSTARFSGTCTRGRAAKRGLPRAVIGPPRCGSGGKRNCHEHENSNGARYILHSKRLINGTNERLRHLKNYGFNAIRFLAHTPLREFFEAADEVGMLLQTEGEWFLAATPMQPGTAAILQAQVPRMIREFENHPAWYSFSCFNEAFNAHLDPVKQAYIRNAYDTFRALKPDHFFVASDGGGDQWPTDHHYGPFCHGPCRRRRGQCPRAAAGLPRPNRRGGVVPPGIGSRGCPATGGGTAGSGPSAQRGGPVAGRSALAAACGRTRGVAADEAQQSLPARGQAFTVAVWVRPEGFAKNDWGTFFSCGAAEPGRALLLALDGEKGDGRLCIGRYFDNILQSQRALVAGRWSHVALTYDGRWIRLWIDGERDAELEAGLDIPPQDIAIGRLVDRVLRAPADYASRPHVWHEFDNTYIAPLPDLDKESRLTGVMTQAWLLEPHRRRIESYGLLPRYPELRQRSIARYREYVKAVYERARQMPRLDGYAGGSSATFPAESRRMSPTMASLTCSTSRRSFRTRRGSGSSIVNRCC